MPMAPKRPCPGCGTLVTRGRCSRCALKVEQRRGSASQRGYGVTWTNFRPRYIALLLEKGIAPVCGAALPDGPQTQDSLCKAEGLKVGHGLHLDHEPPLTDEERLQPTIVCDPSRVQLLCGSRCHEAKTNRQRHRDGRG